ncbi:MAG: ATP-binding protein [Defluviitaleaceae bacterium]|nr:ATP-binding protein [Defluviitaleaceae bacterium]
MNAIIGIAQIELQKTNLTLEYASSLQRIYNSGNSLLGIINDILDMSKIETGKLELNPFEYDFPSMINDAIQLNMVRIGSSPIDFILDLDENLPSRLYGDELRIKQILNNLLSNAIKYTKKGHVKLSIGHVPMEGEVKLFFVVEDTGQGMKPEDARRLFSGQYMRFNAEANRDTEGTGLGLNITQNLIELMGGTIGVESEYNKGSTFYVEITQKSVKCLPIGAELAESLRNFKFSGDKQSAFLQITRELMPYGSVLVVDDVETNLYVAEGLLSSYGLRIDTALSGFAAIEKIEKGNKYDVIFMDHMMPVMDGVETTQELRKRKYMKAIIALTANALVGNDKVFMRKGFDGFISKPIDIRELDSILNRFIRDKYPNEARKYKPDTISETLKINAKVLQVFCGDAEKAIITLQDSFANVDMELFATTAHAIKTALSNVAEFSASYRAEKLENAGLNGDTNYISENIDEFIETLEDLIEKAGNLL